MIGACVNCGKLSVDFLLTLWSNYECTYNESGALKGGTQFDARNFQCWMHLHWPWITFGILYQIFLSEL